MNSPTLTATVAAATATLSATAHAAESADVNELVAKIKSPDDAVRGPAWQGAGPIGAPAIVPLGQVMTDADFEIARCAKRAIERIVRHAGRPGADAERKAVQAELVKLLPHPAAPVRRHALWMLSEIATDSAVAPMSALLADADVRDDARCSLERLPGTLATRALKQAMTSAPEAFKYALAHSLRVRGETVAGYPCQKLVPTKQTGVKAE